MVIGGDAVQAASGDTFETENPYTRRAVGDRARRRPRGRRRGGHGRSRGARGAWGATTGFQRAALMRRFAGLITANAERLAQLEVNDSGKLYREMIGQAQALGGWYEYYAGIADKLEGRQIPTPNPDYLVYTRREPVGVVAAITPWNSPLLLLTWKLAPALAAGCTMVVKPSEHSPAATLELARLAGEAGLPARRGQRRHRRLARARRGAGGAFGRRQGRVHRVDGDRPRSRPRRRREPQQGHARARRQVARRSCSPTPISTRRPTAWWPECSPRPARRAWRARA